MRQSPRSTNSTTPRKGREGPYLILDQHGEIVTSLPVTCDFPIKIARTGGAPAWMTKPIAARPIKKIEKRDRPLTLRIPYGTMRRMRGQYGWGLEVDDYQLAAEPWTGPYPICLRLQRAITAFLKKNENKPEDVYRKQIARRAGKSYVHFELMVDGHRRYNLKPDKHAEVATFLGVSPEWLAWGITSVPRTHGDDYFRLTPWWLRKKLLRLLRLLGHPDAYVNHLQSTLDRLAKRDQRSDERGRGLARGSKELCLPSGLYDGTQDPRRIRVTCTPVRFVIPKRSMKSS
jgi:hypothetical protein